MTPQIVVIHCCDSIYLDLESVMKLLYRNDRSRRAIISHHSRIDCVHRRPQLDVRDVNGHLEYSTEIAAGGFEDLSDVLQALFGLFFDRTGEPRSGLRIDRELARYKDAPVVDDGLRVMPCWYRRIRSRNSCNIHCLFPPT